MKHVRASRWAYKKEWNIEMLWRQFWDGWLLIVGCHLVGFGILLAFGNQTWLFETVFSHHVNSAFWPDGVFYEGIQPFQSWVFGVLGSMLSGWGVCFVYLARYPFKHRERWAWNCIFYCTTLWFIPDTAISAYYGVSINVALNVVVAVLVYLPLIATKSQFTNSNA